MGQKFEKSGKIISSSKGFTVEIKIAGGILYRDSRGEFEIDSEWLAKPPGVILYKGSRENMGFEEMEQSQIDAIFSDVADALSYFGYRPEIWSSPMG